VPPLRKPFAIATSEIADTEEESPAVWKIMRMLEERLVRSRDLAIAADKATVHCHPCDQEFTNIGDLLEHCWKQH
jgi:hypothetical protein